MLNKNKNKRELVEVVNACNATPEIGLLYSAE